jgi:hypothetical protein
MAAIYHKLYYCLSRCMSMNKKATIHPMNDDPLNQTNYSSIIGIPRRRVYTISPVYITEPDETSMDTTEICCRLFCCR